MNSPCRCLTSGRLSAVIAVTILAAASVLRAALPLQPEQIVVTCFSGTINYYTAPPTATPNVGPFGFVVAQFDTQTGTIGPLIPPTTSPPKLWNAGDVPPFSGFHNETGQPWNAARLGEVFGVCVDDAAQPNIYVTATECYNIVGSSTPLPKGPGGPGGVYRLDATSGAMSFGSLPNNAVNGPGLGNVCYRRAGSGTGYLYVSDLEDGKIYRMNAASLTAVGSPFDHGVQGRPNESLSPIADDGTPGLTQFGRRIWGLQTFQNRLYYAVWWEDSRNVNLAESNEIWSVDLDNNGDFIPSTARRRLTLPNLTVYAWSHPIASIDFSPAGTMFVAERYWQYLGMTGNATFGAHHTRILRYDLSGPNWVTTPNTTYHIGGDASFYFGNTLLGANSAGGVAVNCDESIWATGDMFAGSYSTPPNVPFGPGDLGYVYGALRIPTGGNSMYAGPGYGSFAIDYDGNTNSISKFGVGAIATVRDCCVPPPSGLAAWWPLDELNGAPIYADLSGNGNAAFVESGGPLGSFPSPSATAGKVAGASYFINSQTRGRAPNAPSLNFGTNSFTLDCWIKPSQSGPTDWKVIVDKFDVGTARGYAIGLTNGNLALRVGDGTLYTYTGPALNNNVWNFAAVLVDRAANSVRFYLNGVGSVPQSLTPTGSFNNPLDLLIGAPYAPGFVSETALDEIELFNRVLTTNELSTIFTADSRGKCKTGQPPCNTSAVSIVCPTNMTIACAPVVYYPAPKAATTCGTITNISCTPPSGSVFPTGPTVVTCAAYDSLGHSNACTFTITVTPDVTPPVIDCACIQNSFHEALEVVGCQGTVPSLCNYSQCFSDNCCLAGCSQTPPAGTVVGPGVTPITFTVTDCAGNSNSCVVQMTVTPPPQGCGDPCSNKFSFLNLVTTATNGVFAGANGTITATTAGGPFLGLNNTAYNSKFPSLFAASGIVTGYLAQVDFNASLTATFDLSGYAITPRTGFGIWNITEETDTYKIQVFDCSSNQLAPPFPAGTFSFMGWDDDSLSGNIGWYHMTLNPTTGQLSTAPFKSSGTDCDAAFWTNLPPNACKIVVSRSGGVSDGVVFYFAEPDPCCRIHCPTNITVSTCGTDAVVNYPAPTVTGSCPPGTSVFCNPPSGSTFPLGNTTITCSLIDALGTVSDSCAFTVTVLPQQPQWSVICPNPASSINVTGCPPKMPNVASLVSVITNCALSCPLTITQDIPAGSVLTPGPHVAIVSICDCQDNCTYCDVVVNAYAIGGNPTITCPPNQVVLTCNASAVVYYKVQASGYTGVLNCTPPSGSSFPLGTTWVTCTATNACGGMATCSFSVTVKRPLIRWPCGWQVGIGIPFETVGGATTALRPVDPDSPALCVFPNPGNPTSGVLMHLGQAQVVTFTTVLDFTAPVGAGMDFVLPPSSFNTNNTPLLSFRNKGKKGYCVKTAKIFEDDPSGAYRTTAVNTNGQLLDSFTYTPAENLTNEPFIVGFQPGVTNCHVTVELNLADGSMSVAIPGPVTFNAARKGWDGCIYGPDRPIKKPTSRVFITPPASPGAPPISDLYLYASGVAEVGIEEPTITAAGRKWGDGHVTLMKAYDDGDSLEFTRTTETGDDDGTVHVDLGHAESFDLSLTKFATNSMPGEQLLTRTLGPISGLSTQPPFLDVLLLQENSGQVDCSADFGNLGSPTVHVLIYSNSVLVAERTGVTGQLGQPILTLPTWPTQLGKLGGATPCRRVKIPLGLITLPGGSGLPPAGVMGDEFRILAELPISAPHPDYYSGFEFLASEDGDWGVSQLARTTICVPEPVAIEKSSGGVSVTWSGENFRLQGAEQATGPWFDLGASSPVQVPTTSTARFFRLVCD